MEEKLSVSQIDKKRLLREIIFVSLYAVSTGGVLCDELFVFAMEEYSNRLNKSFVLDEDDRAVITCSANDILNKQSDLDCVIQSFLVGWKNERLPVVDLCILRQAVYDILFNNEVPKNVVISEAVLLADTFSDEKDKKFINGVLSSVLNGFEENDSDAHKFIDAVRG